MPGEPRVFEVRVRGCATVEEALALQEPIARLLCPDEHHAGPCEVPWGFTLDDAEGPDDGATVLVLGVCVTSGGRAAEVAGRVRELAGGERTVTWEESRDPERFGELAEQYRIENAPREP
ncbi:hypothetical protein GCM10010420_06190 [Streptomyces glaucosporus]|uniref:Uncharacterized protein n=1 Tax=Streptomyces glaucosporus TaxID=284044 RepID=A0ABP5USZ5_9ACTN